MHGISTGLQISQGAVISNVIHLLFSPNIDRHLDASLWSVWIWTCCAFLIDSEALLDALECFLSMPSLMIPIWL